MSKMSSGEIILHKKDDIQRALFYIDDLFESALCKYLVLKDTAKMIVNNEVPNGEKITLGVERRYLTKGVLTTFKVHLKRGVTWREDGFTVCNQDTKFVPIDVQFIERRYNFFKFPTLKTYYYADFLVANPFKKYWKARFIIK